MDCLDAQYGIPSVYLSLLNRKRRLGYPVLVLLMLLKGNFKGR
jgi:hypothetical protein